MFAVQSRWSIPESHGDARRGRTIVGEGQNQLWEEFHLSGLKKEIAGGKLVPICCI